MAANEITVPCVGNAPRYSHEGDAGGDLRAALDAPVTLGPGESRLIPTGTFLEIPSGYVGLQFARSGLGSSGITLRLGVGVIDSGYRGEILCPLWNTTDEPYTVNNGERVCQLVIVPFAKAGYEAARSLAPSQRGEDGYGSTGVM